MKITASQLRRIIKEEITKALEEGSGETIKPGEMTVAELLKHLGADEKTIRPGEMKVADIIALLNAQAQQKNLKVEGRLLERNMSYVRFENTLQDLVDCSSALMEMQEGDVAGEPTSLSQSETRAAFKLRLEAEEFIELYDSLAESGLLQPVGP